MASTYTSLQVHIIFATKSREPIIADSWLNDLHAYIGGTVRGLGAVALAVGGIEDHVHLLARVKATHSVADLVREIKKASTGWTQRKMPAFSWQTGYAAFSVSPGEIDGVVKYISTQREHHRRVTSTDELICLLREFGIEYDERVFE